MSDFWWNWGFQTTTYAFTVFWWFMFIGLAILSSVSGLDGGQAVFPAVM